MKRSCNAPRNYGQRSSTNLHQEDHLLQTVFHDGPYKTFRVGIQIRDSGRQLDRFDSHIRQHVQKLLSIQGIAIMNQILLSLEEAIDVIGDVARNLSHP